jgi:hypothetical protein
LGPNCDSPCINIVHEDFIGMLTEAVRADSTVIVKGQRNCTFLSVNELGYDSVLVFQTGAGTHPASCPMGSGVPFPGGKARPERDADHSPPSSAEVVNE